MVLMFWSEDETKNWAIGTIIKILLASTLGLDWSTFKYKSQNLFKTGVFLLEQFRKQNVWPMFFFFRCNSTYFRFQERIPQGNRGKSRLPRLSFFWFSNA